MKIASHGFCKRTNSFIRCTFVERSVRSVDCTITFPPINVNWVLQLHEDTLILTLGVGGFNVQRILINLGNSTDILQMSAYRQMGYSPSALKNLEFLLLDSIELQQPP